MKKRGMRMMIYLIGILFILVGTILIFFQLPVSKTTGEFEQKRDDAIAKQEATEGAITEENIKTLPEPLKRYFRYSGFIGMEKSAYMEINYKDVDFIQADKPLKIDYIQYNFTKEPERVAYIRSSLMGIPFEGLDHYLEGNGGMKGVIGKVATLFNVQGEEMKAAGLVTCLAEGILFPSFVLEDYVTWESIDDYHVKGSLSYYDLTVSGIFTFDEAGAFTSFYTSDRRQADEKNGTCKAVDWECIAEDYKETSGIKYPTRLKGIWHEDEGDSVYFDANQFEVKYY